MSSRTIIYYLYVWFFLLALNIWAYYGSDTYRNFIDTLKYGQTVKVTDDITVEQEQKTHFSTGTIGTSSGKIVSSWTGVSSKPLIKTQTGATTGTWAKSLSWVSLTSEEDTVLNAFNEYKLKKLLVHPSLFDLTTEYPDDYFEYYSDDITLYIFSTKTYKQIVDVFQAFASELPFLLNKTDSFGTNSFFINVKPEFQDEFTRVVFEYKQKVFLLKIKKNQYNRVRIMLKNLK